MSMGDNGNLRPPFLLSHQDHGALVVVTSSLLTILSALIAAITLVPRLQRRRKFDWSDCFLVTATVGFCFLFP